MSIKIIDLVLNSPLPALKTDKGKLVTGPAVKFVLLALASHANHEGRHAYPSLDRLCLETGFSLPTVIGALNALRTNGYIVFAGRSQWQTKDYTLSLERLEGLKPLESGDSSGFSCATQPTLDKPSLNRPLNPLVVVDDELSKIYQAEIGSYNPTSRDVLHDWLAEGVPRDWILEAIQTAIAQNVRRPAYVSGIIDNWKTQGKDTRKEKKHADQTRHARKTSQPAPRQPGPEDLALAERINNLSRLRRMGLPPGPTR